MIAESGLSEQAGMELRGRELHEALQACYEMTLLTKPAWHRWRLREMSTRLLCRRIARARPDLVYLHKFGTMPPRVLESLAALALPIVARFGDQYATNVAALLAPARDYLTLVFNCDYGRRFYAPLFPPVRSHTIYTGVDTDRFRPGPGGAGFVFLGRTIREKGFLDFCEAMARLPGALISSIDIIGDGVDLKEGLRRLGGHGRRGLVRWVGPRAHRAVPAQLQKSAILVLPSHPEGSEMLSTAVLEAMACGLAVVASEVAGMAEAVRHEETGLLVPPRDVDALVDACRRLAQDGPLRGRLGRHGRRFVETRHVRASWLRSMMDVMREALRR